MSLPAPIPHEEAQQRLLSSVSPLAEELIAAASATGRYLAQNLLAHRTQPAADLSAMDGYAVRADELQGPWTVVGESAAGHPYSSMLQSGEAIRISTGALMPDGGGGVLLQENATRQGDALRLSGEDTATLRHIRRQGFDFGEGDVLLESGARLNPAAVALAISGGHSDVPVTRLPRLAIIDSGDELARDPANVAPHQIPASNGAMLAAMAAPICSQIDRLGPVEDRLEAILEAFEKASEADVVVTSGGASVGDHDLVRPALEQWGAEISFWRIAMKPGKPLLVARRGEQTIIGLPGNPVSSYVTGFLFLVPLLRRLAGAAQPVPQSIALPLAQPLSATGKRAEFIRARIAAGGSVEALGEQDSSALASLANAQALIMRPANSGPSAIGEKVPVYLLQNGGMA